MTGPWAGRQSGIYQITCSANSKRYIGSAMRLRVRETRHFKQLDYGQHPNSELQAAWRKHGAQTFSFQILLVCSPDDLIFYEQRALDGLKPEFNRCPIAFSTRGRKYTPEGLANVAEANRRRGADPAFRALRSAMMKGVTFSPETRAKLAAALKGRKRPPEVIAKIIATKAAKRGGNPSKRPRPSLRKGLGRLPDWRERLSAFQKGKKRPRKHSQHPHQLSLEI